MTINVFGGGNSGGPAFPLQRSVRLRSSASAYFNRTSGVPTSGSIFTHSFWVKRGILGSQVTLISGQRPTNFDRIYFSSTDTLVYQWNDGTSNLLLLETTQVFRDPSAWYHIIIATDTTQATNTNRIKLYVNGVQVTAFVGTPTYPSQNSTSYLNRDATTLNLGRTTTATLYFDGYLTEVNFVDGQALTPSSFGSINSTTGVWQPIKYTSTYGANGFYLNFQDNSNNTATTIGKDSSGNGNNWTPNNISVTAGVTYDSMLDVPTLTSSINANFATLNPLSIMGSGNTLTNGNLTFAGNGSANIITTGTFGVSSGKWYVEATITNGSGGVGFGIAKDIEPRGSATVGNTANSWGYNSVNGAIANNSSTLSTGATYTTNDVVAFALDMDAGTLTFYKNNAAQGSTVTGLSGTFLVAVSGYLSTINTNFGQRPFSYTPPSGFKSLNTYNLPAPTIPNGATQFAATTYTGTAAALTVTNTVNGKSFQPDFVWIKDRTSALNHRLLDSVRGVTSLLYSNLTDAQATIPNANDSFTSFNSNGFTLGVGQGMNASGDAYVGWQWKASNAAAVTNTSGSISSSVSANPSAGFSIVTYTGVGSTGTVGHGLGIAPKFIITKIRASINAWLCYHSSLGAGNRIYLNQTDAVGASTTVWNNTAPTSSVFSVGDANTNGSGTTMVAYCFSEIAGYSKFGSYTGNGSTDGTFVYLGFRPRWIMVKRTDTTGDWQIYDTSQNPYNVCLSTLAANSANGNSSYISGYNLDVVSNGFKWRAAATVGNASSGTYIYMAVAESPFNYSLAR